jgi:hypothetical protein
MGVAMGDKATVNGASTTQQWKINYLEDDRPYGASNTQMGTGRECGVVDWTGQYWAYGGLPASFPGDALAFAGEGTLGVGASGTAIVERMVILWKQERNDYLRHIVSFAGNGDLALTSGAVTDSSVPNLPCGAPLLAKFGDVTLDDVREMTLDVSRRHGKPPGQLGNRPYSSSSYPGTIRRKKGYLDFTVTIDCYVNAYTALPALKAATNLKLYTTALLYWELQWARIESINEIGAHVEDAELMNVVIEAKMQAACLGALGYIKVPGATTKWPA